MKKSWWRKLAQHFAYPPNWPTCFAYWMPMNDETFPPRVGLSINGKSQWYRIETEEDATKAGLEIFRPMVAGRTRATAS
jgi:hypothetical protein